MSGLAARQRATANNVANVDTRLQIRSDESTPPRRGRSETNFTFSAMAQIMTTRGTILRNFLSGR